MLPIMLQEKIHTMNNVKIEVLKEQRADFISMAERLQRGQDEIYQKKYKQPTVVNYIESLKEQIEEMTKELSKRGR